MRASMLLCMQVRMFVCLQVSDHGFACRLWSTTYGEGCYLLVGVLLCTVLLPLDMGLALGIVEGTTSSGHCRDDSHSAFAAEPIVKGICITETQQTVVRNLLPIWFSM